MESRSYPLALALLLLVVVAGGILVAEEFAVTRRDPSEFQRLVGGIGFGPSRHLSDCPNGFDPRLGHGCGARCGPVPGGDCFCPRHGGPGLLSTGRRGRE